MEKMLDLGFALKRRKPQLSRSYNLIRHFTKYLRHHSDIVFETKTSHMLGTLKRKGTHLNVSVLARMILLRRS